MSRVLTYEQYRTLLGLVHPDRAPAGKEVAYTELFRVLRESEHLLSQPKGIRREQMLPLTVEDLLRRRAEVTEQRRQKRAAAKAAREAEQ